MSTDAQKRASTNYNRKQDNIMMRPSKEEGATIRAAAAAAGKSVQGYVLEAVREKMERERAGGGAGGAGVISIFPDDEKPPHAAVGVSPMQGEESLPAEQLFPDDWGEDEKDLPW